MGINEWLMYVFGGGLWVAALDKLFGCKLGLGKNLDEGLMFMGKIASNMFGIMTLSPLLSGFLKDTLGPVLEKAGVDPCMAVAMFLSPDSGGYLMAMEMASSEAAGKFAGCIVSAIMGPVLLFYLPMAMLLMEKEDMEYLTEGIICGMSVIPVACLMGGLVAGFPILWILKNLWPCIVMIGGIFICFIKWPESTRHFILVFGQAIRKVAVVGIAVGGFELLCGKKLIEGTLSIENPIQSVGYIGIMLAGSMTCLAIINRFLERPLKAVAGKINLDENSVLGPVMSLATNLLTLTMIRTMKPEGKVMNIAFIISAACAFGPHLGYISQMQPDMVPGMLAAKLSGGIAAIGIVLLKYHVFEKKKGEECKWHSA